MPQKLIFRRFLGARHSHVHEHIFEDYVQSNQCLQWLHCDCIQTGAGSFILDRLLRWFVV